MSASARDVGRAGEPGPWPHRAPFLAPLPPCSSPRVVSCWEALSQVGWGGAGGEEVLTGHSSLQSLGQILEAAVSVGSRTLDIHLNSLLAALHAQVGRWRGL